MTKVKIKYATGGYYFTDTYGKVKVLGCKPVNVIRVQQEDGTILELTCIYAIGDSLNVSKAEIIEEDEGGSGSDSSGSSGSGSDSSGSGSDASGSGADAGSNADT